MTNVEGSDVAGGRVADTYIGLFERSSSMLTFDDGTVAPAAQLADEGRRLAGAFRRQGIEPADRLAVHLPNGVEYVRLLLACAAGGFVAVSVNTRYSAAEVTSLVERTGATIVDPGTSWTTSEPIDDTMRPDDPFVVFTTSGTTSRPKMVLHPNRSIAVHAADAACATGYGPADTVLVAMPLCGTFGLTSLTAAIAGDSAVVVTDFELARTAELIEQRRVTAVNGSDDMFHRLVRSSTDLSSVRLGGTARFNTSLDAVVRDAEHCGARLTGLYGMSVVQDLLCLVYQSI
jgi:fatty-acyl-CoA synthase